MDVKYIPSDWQRMKDGIGDLIGLGRWGKGMIDELKDLSDNLEDAESDIAKYDSDGVISFRHTSLKGKYQALYEDFQVLHRFSGKVGDIVDRTIDHPFYEDMDAFVTAMQEASISNYTTKNRIGATETQYVYGGYGPAQALTVPKAEVSLDDIFSGDHFYGKQMQLEYEAWKELNPDQDVTQKEYQIAAVNTRAFEYESIRSQQESKEFWVQLGALVVIVGTTLICPPAGMALGAAYGAMELSSAVSGKDWVSGRELGTGERWFRGLLAPLDIIPGVGAVAKFGSTARLVRIGDQVAGLTTHVRTGIKQGASQVDHLVQTASREAVVRLKSANAAVKDAANVVKNKIARDIIEVGDVIDSGVTKARNTFQLPQSRLVMAHVGEIGKAPIENSHTVGNKMRDVLSRIDGINLESAPKGTGKLNSTKDIYKVSPKDIYQALEGYEQTHKFKAHFRGFEVKAQRSLSHMSDKQLIYSFKKGYSPKDGANDTIVLHHHEQKVEGPIIEMPSRYHDLGNKKQHPFGNSGGVGSGEARIEFNKWRKEYWKARYANEMIKRGIIE